MNNITPGKSSERIMPSRKLKKESRNLFAAIRIKRFSVNTL